MSLLDAISYASHGKLDIGLDRFIQVDIDDVFVGQTGTRFVPDDISALIQTQKELRHFIDNFTFTLGFSGYFFRHGDELENRGDEALVASASHFHWFPHMWRHNHAHETDGEYLTAIMIQNKLFANNTNLPTKLQYAIAPQHSGVYPIYEPLFDAWRIAWDVRVTSTEEYPHLRPASKRRGFIHANISVLPRQTCGLFTHTYYFYAYPDGIESLDEKIFGGELFTSVLMNPFSIFMTHQQNFANDRLGSYTFLNLARFISCHTNLKLKWTTPTDLAERYFAKFPQERTLLYTDPCTDVRHRKMLSPNRTCDDDKVLPNVLILGPQKTGTSALATFLQLHPNVTTNVPVEGSFEELQFFNGANYAKGMEWYAEKFANVTKEHQIVFEKSANYFDSEIAPKAINALLPNALLVVLLMDPADRAYSWYQHMKAHGDPTANKYTAMELFSSNSSEVQRLRNRCLSPGYYVRHFDRWLDYFAPSQFVVIDAKRFRDDPSTDLNDLIDRFGLPRDSFDFEDRLQFNEKKGFFCAVDDAGRSKCLGQSKGRRYDPMPVELRTRLNAIYAEHNGALARFLQKYNFPIPSFLQAFNE